MKEFWQSMSLARKIKIGAGLLCLMIAVPLVGFTMLIKAVAKSNPPPAKTSAASTELPERAPARLPGPNKRR